jgi:TonB family protein
MALRYGSSVLVFVLAMIVSIRSSAESPQEPSSKPKNQEMATPNTSEGLQSLIEDIFRAAKSKDSTKEAEFIRGLLMPEDSKWFTNVFGPGFGANLSTAYRRSTPNLERELLTIFEGDVQRGWTKPKVFRFTYAESAEFPTDKILDCMNDVVPLYQTAVNGTRTLTISTSSADQKSRVIAGDPNGYFVFVDGGFRFIPADILRKLPKGRPVRIKLDMNVMDSKISNKVSPQVAPEAMKKHLSGKVVIELILDVTGNIKESRVLEGDPILSAPVLDAVKQWRFAPTTLDGDPVEVDLQIPYVFDIR